LRLLDTTQRARLIQRNGANAMMIDSTAQWTIFAVVAAIIAFVVLAFALTGRGRARRHTAELRRRFGPEYDRVLQHVGNKSRAERELASRERRVGHIRLHGLNEVERTRFASTWSGIQGQFVDDPAEAVLAANNLIKEVMRARGYPSDNFEERVADLSVDHADVVQHYRAAQALADSGRGGQGNTEELRQAVVHYRALFDDLLHDSPAIQPVPMRAL
jgi:hypothetical protein